MPILEIAPKPFWIVTMMKPPAFVPAKKRFVPDNVPTVKPCPYKAQLLLMNRAPFAKIRKHIEYLEKSDSRQHCLKFSSHIIICFFCFILLDKEMPSAQWFSRFLKFLLLTKRPGLPWRPADVRAAAAKADGN